MLNEPEANGELGAAAKGDPGAAAKGNPGAAAKGDPGAAANGELRADLEMEEERLRFLLLMGPTKDADPR